MAHLRRFFRLSSGIALLCICLLVVGLIPTLPALATRITRPLDNILDDFAPGRFQRTAMVRTFGTNVERDAAVELALLGSFRPMTQANFDLPKRLSRMGAAALGNRIYVAGGLIPGAQNTDVATNEVWSAAVNLTRPGISLPTGRELLGDGWRAELPMPAVIGTLSAEAITATYALAMVAVDNATGNDYLYLFGGKGADSPGDVREVSQFSVRIGVIDPTDGRITRWITSDEGVTSGETTSYPMRIPAINSSQGAFQDGIHSAMAATVTMTNTHYVYLIGGLQEALNDDGDIESVGSKQGFYARVGQDGKLYKPDTTGDTPQNLGWGTLPDVPLAGTNDRGLWDGAIAAVQFGVDATALYLIGGQIRVNESTTIPQTPVVYLGLISPANGTVTWQDWKGQLQETVSSAGAVEFNGSIFLTGGRRNNADRYLDTAQAGYVIDRMELYNFQPDSQQAQHFDVSADNPSALPRARGFHGTVVLRYPPAGAPPDEPVAYVYVLGGVGPSESSEANTSSDDVYVLRISSNVTDDPIFMRSGTYTSRIHQIELGSPKIEAINWTTSITRTGASADIMMEYRTSGSQDCNAAIWNGADQSDDGWQVLDALPDEAPYSAEGVDTTNTVTFTISITQTEVELARCFQYRATFNTSNGKNTPLLDKVTVRIFSPDSPDLKVIDLNPVWEDEAAGKISGLAVDIQNKYENPSDPRPTLNADVEGAGVFYTDVFIVGPTFNGQVVTPTLPLTSTTYYTGSTTFYSSLTGTSSPSYMGIDKGLLPQGETYQATSWCDANVETGCNLVSLPTLFTVEGNYTFCVAVDAYIGDDPQTIQANPLGLVNETLPGAEDNNFYCEGPFFIVPPPPPVPPTVTIELSSLASTETITEDTGVANFTIKRIGDASRMITVSLEVGGTAVISDAYTLMLKPDNTPITQTGGLNVQLQPTEMSKTITVQPVADTVVEADVTVELRLNARDDEQYKAQATTLTVTIEDDDEEPPPPPVYMPLIIR